VMQKNDILVAQMKSLISQYQALVHENTSLKVNLAENQYQNQVYYQ
jgi:hypothetical protein